MRLGKKKFEFRLSTISRENAWLGVELLDCVSLVRTLSDRHRVFVRVLLLNAGEEKFRIISYGSLGEGFLSQQL